MSTLATSRPLLSHEGNTSLDEAAGHAWSLFCKHIQTVLPEKAFHTWFKPIVPIDFREGTLKVRVPSRFYYDWIEGHYASHIERALDETLGNHGKLVYVTIKDERTDAPTPFQVSEPAVIQAPKRAVSANGLNSSGLNSRYIFESFIEGPPNQFARAAALSVGNSPGHTVYNPLLIYGGVGLGKTHLLQAIGNEVLRQNPTSNVRYISSERYTQDFVEAIKSQRADEFSASYRPVDVLLVDDVQFFAGRGRTMMEFFHTFNALHQAGKQIVLTSDRPPRELDGLDDRLVSRFAWGLVCDVGPPDYDTRVAIIQKLSEEEKIDLDTRVTDYLAQHFSSNVREMQGALIRLLAHASLTGSEVTIELAHRALHDLISNSTRRISIENVQSVVAQHFNIAPDLLMAKIRTQPIAKARMIAMALSVRLTGHSLKQVGRHFGKRDHTTVLHAREKLKQWEAEDSLFLETIAGLIKRIESLED